MNKLNGPDPGLDNLLQRTFKDDLPPEAEAGMNQRFLSLKRAIDKTGNCRRPTGGCGCADCSAKKFSRPCPWQ